MMARDPTPETPKMAHDSLVTVRLSEPESLVLDSTAIGSDDDTAQSTPTKSLRRDSHVIDDVRSDLSIDIGSHDSDLDDKSITETDFDTTASNTAKNLVVDTSGTGEAAKTQTPRDSIATMPPPILSARTLQEELFEDGRASGEQEEVNWEQLERTEDEQTKDEETDNVCQTPCPPPSRALLMRSVDGPLAGTT